MEENGLNDDSLLKMLQEDIYIALKTPDFGKNREMYITARQTSQGRQRSYNVGASLTDTVNYNDMMTHILDSDDIYNFTMDQSTATCFASPSMMKTFRAVSQPTDI